MDLILHYGVRIIQRREREVYRVSAETQKPKEKLHMITNESRCNKDHLDKNVNIFLKLEIVKY